MLTPCGDWAERLSAYLDDEAGADERQAVEAHLEACPACRAFAEVARCDAQDAAAALCARPASDGFAARVMGQIAVTPITPVAKKPETPEKPVPALIPFYRRLLEWGVVACTMAVVAAVLFPVFAKSREKSRQSACSNYARQIAVGLQIYAQDNNGTFPSADRWVEAIKLAPGAFHCPLDRNTDRNHVSYLYNMAMSGTHLNDIKDPTNTPLVWCMMDHGGATIMAYVDGHVGQVLNQRKGNISGEKAKNIAPSVPPATVARPPVNALMDEAARSPINGAAPALNKPGDIDCNELIAKKRAPSLPTIAPPDKNYGLADKLQIAYKAEMALQCADVRGSLERTELAFRRFDGFVLTSDYQSTDEHHATATISGRVPSEKLGVLLVELDALGTLQSRSVNGEDLTAQQIEQIEKLGHLQGAQGRIEDIQHRARANTALEAENKMQSAGNEAIGTRVDQYKLHSRVTLAEVRVTLASLPFIEPEPPVVNPVTEATGRALYALRAFGLWLLAWLLIPLLIWSPVWFPLGLLARWLRKRYLPGKDTAKTPEEKKQAERSIR